MANKITKANVKDYDIDAIDKKFEKMDRATANSLSGTRPPKPKKKTVKKTRK